jgi:A/G-specific adenine glycosylase
VDPGSFAGRVIEWQHRHGRHDLPWQRTRDPYRIWLAEVMLQQTQVAAVIPYYARFLQRFPDVHALAAAPLDAVLAAWSGLGYYARARSLHRCAQFVAGQGGAFPRSVQELAKLPGIGRSTAAAVAALAFGARAAILDGNVKRVLARHFGVEGFPGAPAIERSLWTLAESLLPADGVETYTQGLMDLGATVCRRGRPGCDTCPVSSTCVARGTGRTGSLPAPRPARKRPERRGLLLLIRDAAGGVLVEARPPRGIWGGMLGLPEFDAGASDDAIVAEVQSRYALRVRLEGGLPELRHEFTHFSFVMRPRLAETIDASGVASTPLRRIAPGEFDTAPLPAPIRRLLDAAFAEQNYLSTACCFR